MVAHITTFAFSGVEVTPIDVQVHFSSGIPAFNVVGMADKAVSESRERIRAALSSLGLSLPPKRVTVNLSPADLPKEGSHYDLPIALGLLVQMEALPQDALENFTVMGELALDGALVPVAGVLPAAIGAASLKKGIICPSSNGEEAIWAGDEIDVLAPQNLLALINHFKGTQLLSSPELSKISHSVKYNDFRDVKGQETARRALEIAAAGGHNVLMVGPPGSGKSMLASRLPGILPLPTAEEILDISVVRSIAGDLVSKKLERKRPFRDPHHNCSMAAMVGGGSKVRPGEVTLAHKGVLFLDEFPEFSRQVLDSLRQPLETKNVTISRVQSHATFPADFQLIAAMNPCRCGYLGDASRACSRAPRCADDYQSKISGPLMDRIDIHVEVPALSPVDIDSAVIPESSSDIAARVEAARLRQSERYKGESISLNQQLDGEVLGKYAVLDTKSKAMLLQAVEQFGLSMRGHNRVLRVSRTIADLAESTDIMQEHIAEALGYRYLTPHSKAA